VADPPLTRAELVFLEELVRRRVPFMVVGMSAAVLQGAPVRTDDLDLWFPSLATGVDEAARAAGGTLAWRASPPMISGTDLDHIDIVTRPDGLRAFEKELEGAVEADISGVPVKVLPLERVIASKRAAGRPKDKAAMPALLATLAAARRTTPKPKKR
jgi:hypothetical protein